jgi:hypothetical protein
MDGNYILKALTRYGKVPRQRSKALFFLFENKLSFSKMMVINQQSPQRHKAI